MYHSITFISADGQEVNTWDDWHLIPSSRPLFNPPEVKTQYVDIPGGNGQIDLTEALIGYPVYKNRTGSIEFYVQNGYGDWAERYSEIMNFLHGQDFKAFLEDDIYFLYKGRFDINQWKSDQYWSLITIDYSVYPYKKERNSSLEDWLWDPFDFENGVIREYKNLTVPSGGLTLYIPGSNERISPKVIVEGAGVDASVTFYKDRNNMVNSQKFTLSNGDNYLPWAVIESSEAVMIFTGMTRVSVDYQGGSL